MKYILDESLFLNEDNEEEVVVQPTEAEDIVVDIPEVEEVPVEPLDNEDIQPQGPQPGEEAGMSLLLTNCVSRYWDFISELQVVQTNLINYPELAEQIQNVINNEMSNVGIVQGCLMQISPNASIVTEVTEATDEILKEEPTVEVTPEVEPIVDGVSAVEEPEDVEDSIETVVNAEEADAEEDKEKELDEDFKLKFFESTSSYIEDIDDYIDDIFLP